MLKVQLLLAKRDIVDDLSTVDSDGLADLLLGGRLPKHHFISSLAFSTSNPQTPTIHMVIRLQNWASGVSKLFQVRFAVMESREPGVAVEASVGLEAGVHVVVECQCSYGRGRSSSALGGCGPRTYTLTQTTGGTLIIFLIGKKLSSRFARQCVKLVTH